MTNLREIVIQKENEYSRVKNLIFLEIVFHPIFIICILKIFMVIWLCLLVEVSATEG